MDTITATYRVVTPLFLSGADQAKAELRLPSLKGALRFWWRALAWERLGDLGEIRRQEAELFGSTDKGYGQAGVLMKLEILDAIDSITDSFDPNKYPGLIYLGYGVMDFNGNVVSRNGMRAYIPSETFKLHLTFKKCLPEEAKGTVIQAVKILGLLGNIGSKARKGYGSLSLVALTGAEWSVPKTAQELASVIRNVLPQTFSASLPTYTAFSQQASVDIVSTGNKALDLLNFVGEQLQLYRSWGRHNPRSGVHEINQKGTAALQAFAGDHNSIKDFVIHGRAQTPARHPERIAFGLPHNYFFSSINPPGTPRHQRAPDKAEITSVSKERRASPLFIHVQEVGEGFAAVISVLPATFLPPEEKIRITRVDNPNPRRRTQVLTDQQVDFSVIKNFLSDQPFAQHPNPTLRTQGSFFPKRIRVYPQS